MPCPRPINEADRLAMLRDLRILDTEPSQAISTICQDAARTFSVPIALVSLIDSDRQWFKAKVGLQICETVRDAAICNYALLQDEPFVVPDTLLDSRFSELPLVTNAPRVRFYAGAPLHFGDNIRLGTLCIIDTRPRTFSEGDVSQLQKLADKVVGHLWRHDMQVNAPLYQFDAARQEVSPS